MDCKGWEGTGTIDNSVIWVMEVALESRKGTTGPLYQDGRQVDIQVKKSGEEAVY